MAAKQNEIERQMKKRVVVETTALTALEDRHLGDHHQGAVTAIDVIESDGGIRTRPNPIADGAELGEQPPPKRSLNALMTPENC